MTAITERQAGLTGHDQYLFREGTHSRLYEKLGAHLLPGGGVSFAVWAPTSFLIMLYLPFGRRTRKASR